MRKLLNTLYVTTPEAYLTKDGENVVIRVKEKDIFRIPVLNIEGIVTFGYIGASPALMKMCAERNVGLCFLSANGQFQGRVSGPTKGNVLYEEHNTGLPTMQINHWKSVGFLLQER